MLFIDQYNSSSRNNIFLTYKLLFVCMHITPKIAKLKQKYNGANYFSRFFFLQIRMEEDGEV